MFGSKWQRGEASREAHWLVVGTVCVGAFMGQFDASVVTAALPRLAHDFHATVGAVVWVALAYSLAVVATIVVVGNLSDARGRKRFYLYGFAVFTASSALCGSAPTLAVLIGARVLQGLGAAMLQANSGALIRDSTPDALFGRAVGWQTLAQALGLALGPALGGVLLSFLSWRWLFWVNLPVGVIGVAAGRYLLPASRVSAKAKFGDSVGAVLLALATGLPLVYLSLAKGLGYANGRLIAALAAGLLCAWGFVIRERRVQAPLVDLSIFRHAGLSVGLGVALACYATLFGALSSAAFYLDGRHVGPLAAGVELGLLPVALAIITPFAGTRARHARSSRTLTAVGAAITGVGLLVTAVLHDQLGVVIGLAVAGIGQGIFMPANNAGIIRAAPEGRSGLVNAVLNMTRSMGTAIGVALASLLYSIGDGVGADPGRGLSLALGVLAVTALLAGMAVFALVPGGSHQRRSDGRRSGRALGMHVRARFVLGLG